MSPTLQELRSFVTVVECGSFTRAAAALRISQPALSRSVARLERSIGSTLLLRTTRAVEPTADGVELCAIARDVLGAQDVGLRRFAAYLAGTRGRVTLAALPSIAAGVLPGILARFAETHPDVEVRIREGFDAEVVRLLVDGSADLAVTDSRGGGEDLVSIALDDDPMVAVLHPDSPLAARERLTWSELAAEPFVAFAEGSSVRRLTDRGFDAVSARPARVLEASAISTVAGLIAARFGVTAVPRTVVTVMTFVPVVTRPLVAPVITRTIALRTRSRPALTPAAQQLAASIRRDSLGPWRPEEGARGD